MEALEHLQAVHSTLRLMREHALCSGDLSAEVACPSSDRFMADFFLFLSQTCADAPDLKGKCDTLIEQLPKVSFTFLQALVVEKCRLEASRRDQDAAEVPPAGCESLLAKNTTVVSPITVNNFRLNDDKDSAVMVIAENIHRSKSQTHNAPLQEVSGDSLVATQLVPLVGLQAMERASTTLEDFCRSYFMFHAMDANNPQHLFKHLPILSFVEAVIYQLDEENEEQLQTQSGGSAAFCSPSAHQDASSWVDRRAQEVAHVKVSIQPLFDEIYAKMQTCNGEQCQRHSLSCLTGLGTQPFKGLQQTLAAHGLLTERIESELRDGVEYWRLEQALCKSVTKGIKIAAEDALRAIKLKSFDYRVLNLLLYSLTGREVNEAHFNFLAVSELLVEISDDLFDYEDDVLKNSFNILRMFVKVYGPCEAPEMLAKVISEEEMRYQHLLEGLEPSLARLYEERCKQATNEGGGSSKHQFGSWTMPPLIVDEMKFRANLCSTSPN